MEGLIAGRICHYVAYNGQHLAAMVIGSEDAIDGEVDLLVLTNMLNSAGKKNFGFQFHQDVKYSGSKEPGTWHWVEQA